MNRFVFPLAMLLLAELICSAINKALAPYETAFWTRGRLCLAGLHRLPVGPWAG
jgi:hypothetical protein